MSIKRIFIAISAIFAASAVFADNSSVTSKKYVDDLMSGYQGKLPGSGANTLMIYDDETGIGEKAIAATLGNSASAVSVPTVGAVKTGLDGKQDTITGTAGYVMTGTGNPGEVGERAIYGTAVYSNSLVSAETVNTSVTNAVNSSLIRVDENGAPSDTGTLWEINTDVFALGVLPAGYTQLEWVESTGTQYIDTGVVLDKIASEVFVDFQKIGSATSVTLLGSQKSDTGGLNLRQTYYFPNSSNITLYNSTSSSYSLIGTADNDRHTINTIIDKNNNITVNLDGNTSTFTQTSDRPDNTLSTFLFANNINNSASQKISAKMYRIWIKNALGILVFDGVPAKNSSGVVGMYNLADPNPNTAFHTNAGNGEFIAGPPVEN